jgi:hypothetical protein
VRELKLADRTYTGKYYVHVDDFSSHGVTLISAGSCTLWDSSPGSVAAVNRLGILISSVTSNATFLALFLVRFAADVIAQPLPQQPRLFSRVSCAGN